MRRRTTALAAVLALSWCFLPVLVQAQTAPVQSLSARQAVRLSLQHSASIKEAQLNLKVAQLQLEAAQVTSAVPSISLNLTPPILSQAGFSGGLQGTLGAALSLPWGTKTNLSADLGLQWDEGGTGVTPISWGLSFSQQLDLSQLKNPTSTLASKRSALLDAQWAWTQAQQSVVITTLREYGGLLSDKVSVEQAQASLKSAQDQLSVVQSQVKAGQASQSALLDARLGVLEAQIALSKSHRSYITDKASFAREMLGTQSDFDPQSLALALDRLQTASHTILANETIPDSAIANTSQVRNAQDAVSNAEDTLTSAKMSALPTLSVQANAGSDGWKIGVGIAFDLFAPDRQINVQIAQAQLDLAQERLAAAQDSVRNTILSERATLENALQSVEQIKVEEQKWSLEETVNQTKLKAGLLSAEDWDSFQAQKTAFLATVEQTKTSLLVAYLTYCNSLGVQANWEDWIQ
jgi:outer membrane protein TolC